MYVYSEWLARVYRFPYVFSWTWLREPVFKGRLWHCSFQVTLPGVGLDSPLLTPPPAGESQHWLRARSDCAIFLPGFLFPAWVMKTKWPRQKSLWCGWLMLSLSGGGVGLILHDLFLMCPDWKCFPNWWTGATYKKNNKTRNEWVLWQLVLLVQSLFFCLASNLKKWDL